MFKKWPKDEKNNMKFRINYSSPTCTKKSHSRHNQYIEDTSLLSNVFLLSEPERSKIMIAKTRGTLTTQPTAEKTTAATLEGLFSKRPTKKSELGTESVELQTSNWVMLLIFFFTLDFLGDLSLVLE
jgi:hypothetical protein